MSLQSNNYYTGSEDPNIVPPSLQNGNVFINSDIYMQNGNVLWIYNGSLWVEKTDPVGNIPEAITYQSDSLTFPSLPNAGDNLIVTDTGLKDGVISEQWIYDSVEWVKVYSISTLPKKITAIISLSGAGSVTTVGQAIGLLVAESQTSTTTDVISITGGTRVVLPAGYIFSIRGGFDHDGTSGGTYGYFRCFNVTQSIFQGTIFVRQALDAPSSFSHASDMSSIIDTRSGVVELEIRCTQKGVISFKPMVGVGGLQIYGEEY